MEDNLPYRAEYAKSNRSSCKGCKKTIPQDTLRLAVMVQSAFHDGKNPNWFHWKCFFDKQRPKSVGDIAHFEQIRYEDQKKVEDKIKEMSSVVVATGNGKGKGKKRANNSDALKDYGIEYSKSGRAACRGCELKIAQGEIRIKKVSYETEVGMKYGGQPLWHHLECFAQVRNELGYLESGDILPGFKTLKKEDQVNVKKIIPAIKSEEVPIKKMKTDDDQIEDDKFEKKLMKQTKSLFKYRDYMKDSFKKPELIAMLTKNKQEIPEGNEEMLDRISDMLLFGRLIDCEKCGGQFVFNKSGYICTGNLTEWVKCHSLVKEPKRERCIIPKDILEDHPFFKSYKCVVSERIFKYTPPTVTAVPVKKEENAEGPRVHREKPPLYNMEFVIIGQLEKSKDDIKVIIQKLGGKLTTKIHNKTAAILSNEKEVKKMGSRMVEASDMKIQVVPIDFLNIVTSGDAISYISSKSICDWGSDPNLRICQEDEKKSNKSKSIYTKSVPSKITLKLKGGIAVDPDSELEDVAHVLVEQKNIYNVVLSLTDLQSGKNSFYKMQVLIADKKNKFWVFRSWGRIGTTIGSNKLEKFNSKYDAIDSFKNQFLDKTGNEWDQRDNFEKYPGKYIPIDIDYEENIPKKMNEHSSIKSELEVPVQNLIKLLFDVDNMKKAMLEFELDTEKMPLGKLSSKQVQKAYTVLTELSNLISNGGDNSQFTDASNRFYTLIPHSFGVNQPPLLDTIEIIKLKTDMLESLLEIELAYNMLKDEDDQKNPIDTHYEQLKTDMTPILHDSDEFKLLEQYVQNTHAETHNQYALIIEDIFKVARKGEDKRYKPFKKLHNRKLLWHGSRLTNFAGILSHGLKIAPPEAPVTGYMFGKGIYFADMVSKSANYCFTSINNSTGLLLLCEVALGDMLECKEAKYVTKLPKDKHSTKGIGQFQPNTDESIIQKDGVEIPLGKATKKNIKSSLLYNEYIVYDVAQVNVKYLFKMKFDYNI